MNTSFQVFLLAAEELSFTKAAKRSFITQQCLSNHIRHLEEFYGITLFERRPKLRLTPAGEFMVKSLKQIQIIEKGMESQFHEIKEGVSGKITLGINATRARILLPRLFAEYHVCFPNVQLSIVLDDAKQLIPMLLDGKLDLFLGVNCPHHELLRKIPLKKEQICLIATRKLLESHSDRALPRSFGEDSSIDLRDFSSLPFIGNKRISTFNELTERYLSNQNIHLHRIVSISDYDTQIEICGLHQAAAFCPEIVLDKVIARNRLLPKEDQILIFKLRDFTDYLTIDLVEHIHAHQPLYVLEFASMLREHYRQRVLEVQQSGQV